MVTVGGVSKGIMAWSLFIISAGAGSAKQGLTCSNSVCVCGMRGVVQRGATQLTSPKSSVTVYRRF